ncbi:hypothetical protein EMIHUDRAFT_255661, partial [Emiliania huxleyi CCMP1516]|uniref:Uncharacterized protein n=2 Tax=Emiliania huxleyi TaxID=2903 RepID=A0A0D3J760_EMIH1
GALRGEEAREEGGYDRAAARKGELVRREEAAWAALAGQCRACLAARRLAEEVAALREALDQKLAEQAECGVSVARCDAAIEAVEVRLAASAGAAELRSKLDALEQAGALILDALADCRAAQRRHGDAVVQGEAEAGRLQLEVKGLQDQRARLELEALCVKLDGDEDVALQQQVLEQ